MSKFIVHGSDFSGELMPLLENACLGKIFYNFCKRNEYTKYPIWIHPASGKQYTIRDIFEKSVKLALTFKKMGIKKGDILGIVSENNLNYLLPMVAGFYLGAVSTCFNPNYTSTEMQHCLSISKPKIIFCSLKTLDKMRELKLTHSFIEQLILLDDCDCGELTVGGLIDQEKSKDIELENFDPHETDALILFSSGTSGFPKGVLLTHANMVFIIKVHYDDDGFYDQNYGGIIYGLLPYFHLMGALVVMMSVMMCFQVIVIDKFQPQTFLEQIEKYKINLLYLVPPLALFLDKTELIHKYDVSSIKHLICGGAPLAKELQESIEKKFNLKIKQVYGLTELSGSVLMTPKDGWKYGSVGKVVSGCKIKVVGLEDGKILGPNQVGEILVKCAGIMKKYLYADKEQIDDNILDEEGYFRTGDVGYYDDEGYFFIVDRIKELIKYKGFQVAPAELEDLLLKHEGVLEAAVVGKQDERCGEVPVAFVVKKANSNVTEEELIKYVAERVSAEKRLTGGVRFVNEIPKTASGKILRRLVRQLL